MKTTKSFELWGKLLLALLWILILGGIAYDLTRNQFVNPLGVLMLFILIVGAVSSRLRNQPVLSMEGWKLRTVFAVALLVLTVGYIFLRIYVLK